MTEFQVSFPGLGIFNLPIRRELINIFGFPIYWYGVIAAIALAIVMALSLRRSRKFGFSPEDMADYYLFLLPGSIIGARLYYVAFSFANFRANLLTVFDIRSGGLAFYGGVIGGCLMLYFVCLYKKQNYIALLGFLAPYLALGQGIARIANFFNQEAFGTNTTLPWGMISNGTKAYLESLHMPNLNPDMPVHPTFLYEFVGNLLIFALLIALQNYLYKKKMTSFNAALVEMEHEMQEVSENLANSNLISAATAALEPDTSTLTLATENIIDSLATIKDNELSGIKTVLTDSPKQAVTVSKIISVLQWQDSALCMAFYCLFYGALRFFVEGIRTDALYIGESNLRVSQVVSLLMVVFSLLYTLYYVYTQQKELK